MRPERFKGRRTAGAGLGRLLSHAGGASRDKSRGEAKGRGAEPVRSARSTDRR
jgi:hypothetical protein